MAEEKLNLIQKLSKIRQMADVVTKSKRGYNYTYADISDILAKIRTGMSKYGVSLIPLIVPGTTSVENVVYVNTKMDKQGNAHDITTSEFLTKADMVFRWVNDENDETIEVPWTLMGAQADPSQAFGSGMTYCTRYFMTNYFQIPQVENNDVDAYRSKQKAAEAAEDLAIAQSIIAQFDTKIRVFLSDNPDKKKDIEALVKRYTKTGDYNTIKNAELAAKLLKEFTEKFEQKENA